METKVSMALVREARKAGGDRYEGRLPNGEEMVIYIPQKISRDGGAPCTLIDVTFKTYSI